MIEDYKNVWVYIETEHGKAKSVGLELLNAGRGLLAENEKLIAILVGYNLLNAAEKAIEYGADQAILVESAEYEDYNTDIFTSVFQQLIAIYKPSVVLFGATSNGRDLAPRVACRLKTGLTADCTNLSIDNENGNVEWTRPTFGGNLMAVITCPYSRPQMGTVRPGVFKKSTPDPERKGEIIYKSIDIPQKQIRTRLLEFIKYPSISSVNLEQAEIIVAGGRGMGNAENFTLLRDLASVMNAAIGASRVAVDSGWIDHIYQIGQTGKTVSPKIYFACGISGSLQHLAGITSADTIIAINHDPNAPIFKVADFGIVGDLFKIIPAIIEKFDLNFIKKIY